MNATTTTMMLGWQHHQAGNLPQAEAAYRAVLAAEPTHADATYLLAVVCHAQGRIAESIPLYREFLQVKPGHAEVYNSLGVAHATLGQPDEALACYQEATRLKPDYAEAFNNLGSLQAAAGRRKVAEETYRHALGLKPLYPEALNNLGILLFQERRVEEAIQSFQIALTLQPQYAKALNNLGNAWLSQGNLAEAGECFRRALRLEPDDAATNNNVAGVYLQLQRWDDAANSLRKSLAANPNDPKTHRNLGNVFFSQGKQAEALASYQNVLALSPNDVEARLLVEGLRGGSTFTRVPADFVGSLYDGMADHFDRNLVERRGYRSPELLKAALEPGPEPRSLDVLDLGCGTGLCGVQFRDWAKTLRGVDLSPNMLTKARERNLYDELTPGDLLVPLQEAQDQFDLVLASDVLLYLGDLEPVTRAVARALRPGGRFAFTVDVLEESGYRLLPFLHFAHSRDYLQNVATQAELQVIGMNPVEFPREGGHLAPGLVVVLARPRG